MAKEKEIDGIRFSVAPFQAIEALKLKPFLVKKFGPSIGQALGVLKDGLPESGSINDVHLDGAALSQAVEKLMEQLSEDDFISLIKRLFRNVTAFVPKEEKLLELTFTDATFENSMNLVFSGRLFSVYPVMLLVLEANYPDFFGKTAQAIGSRIKKIATSEPAKPSAQSATIKSGT